MLNNANPTLLDFLQRKILPWVMPPHAVTRRNKYTTKQPYNPPAGLLGHKENNEPIRMSNKQLALTTEMVAGSIVFNTTDQVRQRYDGKNWTTIQHYPGERWLGGIVVDINETGEHGFVTAISNQNTLVQWKDSFSQSSLSAVENNSISIPHLENWKILRGIHTSYAIRMASRYCVSANGAMIHGWQIPSLDALLLILQENIAGKNLIKGAAWGFQDQDTISWLYLPPSDEAEVSDPQQYFVRLVHTF